MAVQAFRQKTYRFTIKGDEWKVLVLAPNIYVKRWGNNSQALTVPDQKLMVFNTDCISLKVVRHELFHAYVTYLYHQDAQLSLDQFEEMMCTFIETNVDQFITLANNIFNKIDKYTSEPNYGQHPLQQT